LTVGPLLSTAVAVPGGLLVPLAALGGSLGVAGVSAVQLFPPVKTLQIGRGGRAIRRRHAAVALQDTVSGCRVGRVAAELWTRS
jgi:H+/Cl- antiporter ClcA